MNVRRKQARTAAASNADWRWRAVVARDPEADGKFIYSVKTTGVYCRPSCPSRLAERKNVVFHKTPAAAAAAGFLPCKRCKPGRPMFKSDTSISPRCADGKGADIGFAVGQSVLGPVLVAKSQKGVCAILLGDDREALVRDMRDRFPKARLADSDKDFASLISKVVCLIETPRIRLDLPLDIRGTEFQQRVWTALRKIPVGSTATYTDIAKQIGSPKSVRAVAQACGANAIAVAIPCHRVIRHDGALSGYRWGVERKRALLEREAAAA